MELGEAVRVLAPVKGTAINNDTAYRSAMASDPLGGGVNDNIDAVVDGTTKEPGTAKGVVAL
jgi:hypothetical protein